MSYNITVAFSPSDASMSIYSNFNNPQTINAGEVSTVFNFVSTGLYYKFYNNLSDCIAISGADIVIDSFKVEDYNRVLNFKIQNAISDVQIVLKPKEMLNSIGLNSGFEISSKDPVDTRLVLTKAQMRAIDDNKIPPYYFAICPDDGMFYVYNITNGIDANTGRWRLKEYEAAQYADNTLTRNNVIQSIKINGIEKRLVFPSVPETAKQKTLDYAMAATAVDTAQGYKWDYKWFINPYSNKVGGGSAGFMYVGSSYLKNPEDNLEDFRIPKKSNKENKEGEN